MSYGSAITTLYLLLASPLIAVCGVAYIFRPATRTLWELELLSGVQPFQLLYARLSVILGLNIAMVSMFLVIAGTQGFQWVIWRLLLIWLGPMICLTGVALFSAVRWNALVGVIAPLMVWSGFILLGWHEANWNVSGAVVPVYQIVSEIAMSNTLLYGAVAALIIGLILVIESGRVALRWR